jgi:hypothetical protein
MELIEPGVVRLYLSTGCGKTCFVSFSQRMGTRVTNGLQGGTSLPLTSWCFDAIKAEFWSF